jgi:transcription termination factor Rho
MSDKDKSATEETAPKRRGRRPKPAALSPATTLPPEARETVNSAVEGKVFRGRGPARFKRETEEAAEDTMSRTRERETSSERAPERESGGEAPPEVFSTSDEDLRESAPPPREEPAVENREVAPREPVANVPEAGPRPEGDAPMAPERGGQYEGGGQGGYRGDRRDDRGYYGGDRRGDRGYRDSGHRPAPPPWKNDRFKPDPRRNKFENKGPYPPRGNFQPSGPKPTYGGRPPMSPPPGGRPPRWQGQLVAQDADTGSLILGELPVWEALTRIEEIERMAEEGVKARATPLDFNALQSMTLKDLEEAAREAGLTVPVVPLRRHLLRDMMKDARAKERPIKITGILELLDDGHGLLAYLPENYRLRSLSCFVPKRLIERWGLQRGHEVEVQALPPREGESCPLAVKIVSVNEEKPEKVAEIIPFTELTPYYPTERFLLETSPEAKWDNQSMRVVDLLTPIGLGQRGLIVAPPRTGKTILMQGIANSIRANRPDVHMIILLVDERPEEVTDFRRTVEGADVVSSTFDEAAESHVHAAEMVIERARRMVEYGKHVVILLDSITRLARAYNTLMPSSGKILSGGVEASALQKPKRFFGSARNIEGGGSLTILGTALVETGSKMDEVIFEEFKGTGNMELDLDRALSDKRIFPALSFEKSGTRKEELLYHKDELQKIYSLRRAMKGVPSTEAMEMLIQRVKKTKSNAEFLVSLNR